MNNLITAILLYYSREFCTKDANLSVSGLKKEKIKINNHFIYLEMIFFRNFIAFFYNLFTIRNIRLKESFEFFSIFPYLFIYGLISKIYVLLLILIFILFSIFIQFQSLYLQ